MGKKQIIQKKAKRYFEKTFKLFQWDGWRH